MLALRRQRTSKMVAVAVLAVLLVVVVIQRDAILGWLAARSFFEDLGLCLVALLLVFVTRQRRSTVILPFRNLTGEQAYDALAQGFAERLELEIRRINRLRTEAAPFQYEGINAPARAPGIAPGVTKAGGLETASGVGSDAALGEVATLDMAGIRLPLGALIRGISRAPTISGGVLKVDGKLRFVGDHTGRRRGKWEVWSEDLFQDGDWDHALAALARELAYRMVWDTLGEPSSGADWRSFRELIEGLDHYERYLRDRLLGHLELAEQRLLAAVAFSPRFASAYYNLGVIHEEQARARLLLGQDRSALQVMASAMDVAMEWYQRALAIDPGMTGARIQLARGHFERRELDQAIASARLAVALSRSKGIPCAGARHWLGKCLAASAERPGSTDHWREAIAAYRGAERDYRLLARQRPRQGADEYAVRPLAAVLAEVATHRGEAHFSSGQHRRACRAFRQAIRHQPHGSVAHMQLGRVLTSRRRFDDAWPELAEAVRLDPSSSEAVWALGEWLRDAGCVETARTTLSFAVTMNPRDPAAWRCRADLNGGDSGAQNLAMAGLALALEPTNSESYQSLATLHRAVGEPASSDEAARTYEELADVVRSGGELTTWLGDQLSGDSQGSSGIRERIHRWCLGWLLGTHAPEEAIEHLVKAGDLPEAALSHDELGSIYQCAGRLEEAARSCERAVAVQPEDAGMLDVPIPWRLRLADVCAKLQDCNTALEQYTWVIDSPPIGIALTAEASGSGACSRGVAVRTGQFTSAWRAQAFASRGAVFAALGSSRAAKEDCEQAILLEPGYAFPYDTLARLRRDEGDDDGAIEAWQRAAALAPQEAADIAREIARLYVARAAGTHQRPLRQGWLNRAVAQYRRAVSVALEPVEEAQLRAELGSALADLGRYDEAIGEYERAVLAGRGSPSVDGYHVGLARAYERSDRYPEAATHYHEAWKLRENAYRDASEDESRTAALALAEIQNRIAYLYAEQDVRLDEGLNLIEQALTLASNSLRLDDESGLRERDCWAAYLDTRAWLRHKLGDEEGAITDLLEAIRFSTGTIEERQHLAVIYEARAAGRVSEADRRLDLALARREWTHVRNLDPENEVAAQALARLPQA
ncbi:MAG: tetratricopeptide repeat protein [Egibacteraceae bacterium]